MSIVRFMVGNRTFRFDNPSDPTYAEFFEPAIKGFSLSPEEIEATTHWDGHYSIGQTPQHLSPEDRASFKQLCDSKSFQCYRSGGDDGRVYITCTRAGKGHHVLVDADPTFRTGNVYPHLVEDGNPATRELMRDALVWPTRNELMYARLAFLDTAVMHSSHVEVDGRSILFTGHSGAGKSTAAKLWVAAGHNLRNDETNLLYLDGETAMCGSTPWHGEIKFFEPGNHPLAAIFFLNQSPVNRLEVLPPSRVIGRILANLLTPRYNREVYQSIMPVVSAIAARVPGYVLHCTADERAVQLVKETLFANV